MDTLKDKPKIRRLKKEIEGENLQLQQKIKNLERDLQDAWASVEPEKITKLKKEKKHLVQQLHREARSAGQTLNETNKLRHQLKVERRKVREVPNQPEKKWIAEIVCGIIGGAIIGVTVGVIACLSGETPENGH